MALARTFVAAACSFAGKHASVFPVSVVRRLSDRAVRLISTAVGAGRLSREFLSGKPSPAALRRVGNGARHADAVALQRKHSSDG